jgi:hypothetical protein
LIRNVFLPLRFELKMAYEIMDKEHKQDMVKRIKAETSGDFERALVAYVECVLKGQ